MHTLSDNLDASVRIGQGMANKKWRENSHDKKRVLIIAYHFPPQLGSSGLLRTLKFVRYLPEFEYEPIVLTINSRAYENKDYSLLAQIPDETLVYQALGFDTKRHLSFRGAYLDIMATPDRYVSWIPGAIFSGIRLIRKLKIDLLFSTYPVPSAHLIGWALHRISRLPWLADFRDPMWDKYSQLNPRHLKARKIIEAKTVKYATQAIVVTEGMRRLFMNRYPEKTKFIKVIENGYDESDFQQLNFKTNKKRPPIRLVHTGLLEPNDRDPVPFFYGIKHMVENGNVAPDEFIVELFAPGNKQAYDLILKKLGLTQTIRICERVPYYESLKQMVEADILLLFQGPSCNDQVPAKAYEYLRIGRPIFALTPKTSDTGTLVLETRAGMVVPPDQPEAIASALEQWIKSIKQGIALPAASFEIASKFSRKEQTKLLAQCFDAVLNGQ